MKEIWGYHLLIFTLCWIWGLAFIAVKSLLEEVSFLTINMGRFFLASIALVPVLFAYRSRRPGLDTAEWGMLFLAGICAAYGYHLSVNYGETLVPAGTASIIANTTPIFAALLTRILLRERLGAWKMTGILIAMAGVMVVTVFGGEGLGSGRLEGVAFIFIAAISWAIYTVVLWPLTLSHSVLHITAYSIILGAVTQLPFLGGEFFRDLQGLSGAGWGWLLFLGLGSTVVGYVMYVKAVEGLGTSVAAFYLYFISPISLLWAWIILGESINLAIVGGTVMIIAGLLAVSREEKEVPLAG
ncbi:MAG: DMT family transporter [Actinomycetota bacterium]|nr:DMT family transporter [Actinomycetota bacterium]